MNKKDQSPEKIIKQHVAKVKAKEKAAERVQTVGTAVVGTDGKYTVPKKCIECGAIRMCKPQDAWQIKRCVACQEKKNKAGLKAFVAKVTDPAYKIAKKVDNRMAKLDAWVDRMNVEMASEFARLADYQKRMAQEPKCHRIWP